MPLGHHPAANGWPADQLSGGDERFEPVDQLALCRVDSRARGGRPEPGAAIHLGELEPAPRAAGPLGAHHVAPDRGGVGVALPRPGVHELPTLLPDASERQERRRGPDAGLLQELALGGREQILALLDEALGDGPRAGIAVAPERTARVCEKHLEARLTPAEEEQSGAYACRRSHSPSPLTQRTEDRTGEQRQDLSGSPTADQAVASTSARTGMAMCDPLSTSTTFAPRHRSPAASSDATGSARRPRRAATASRARTGPPSGAPAPRRRSTPRPARGRAER